MTHETIVDLDARIDSIIARVDIIDTRAVESIDRLDDLLNRLTARLANRIDEIEDRFDRSDTRHFDHIQNAAARFDRVDSIAISSRGNVERQMDELEDRMSATEHTARCAHARARASQSMHTVQTLVTMTATGLAIESILAAARRINPDAILMHPSRIEAGDRIAVAPSGFVYVGTADTDGPRCYFSTPIGRVSVDADDMVVMVVVRG